jgi:hypothetical protein
MKLTSKARQARCRRVLVNGDVILPPQSQSVIPISAPLCNLSQPMSDTLLESRQFRLGLMIARTLIPSNQVQTYTCILNTTNEQKTLADGECLGHLEEADVCQIESFKPSPHSQPPSCPAVAQDSLKISNVSVVGELSAITPDRSEQVKSAIDEMISKLPPEITPEQRQQIVDLLWDYQDVLSVNDFDLGYTDMVSHKIDTGNHPPIKERLRRHPQAYLSAIDNEVNQMLSQGVIEPASSPWAANVVIVRKKDGKLRCAIDYRRLNQITKGDSYPLPHIDACLDALNGSSWFSTLDLRSGYWQVRQDPQDADKTAFITRRGCYRFKVLSFGLSGAPSLFQRLMNLVLAGLTWSIALVYLDDIVVFARNFEEHRLRLRTVLERLRVANLKVKPVKCQLFQRKIIFWDIWCPKKA